MMAGTDLVTLMQWPSGDVAGLMGAIDSMAGRRIAVPGTLNFRDTGGYPVDGGGAIGWGKLLRSDALHRADAAALSVLDGLGLRTVLDLRTSYEANLAPSPLDDLARSGALTAHVSLLGDELADLPADLGEIYDYVIDRQGLAVAAAIRCLATPGALPALVHCTAGKDRTGIVVAMALSAVGVPDHLVAADYALTSLYLDPEHTPTIGHVQQSTGLGDRLTAALLASPPELILRTLARARARGGTIGGYLAGHGVPDADIRSLRAALVTKDG